MDVDCGGVGTRAGSANSLRRCSACERDPCTTAHARRALPGALPPALLQHHTLTRRATKSAGERPTIKLESAKGSESPSASPDVTRDEPRSRAHGPVRPAENLYNVAGETASSEIRGPIGRRFARRRSSEFVCAFDGLHSPARPLQKEPDGVVTVPYWFLALLALLPLLPRLPRLVRWGATAASSNRAGPPARLRRIRRA